MNKLFLFTLITGLFTSLTAFSQQDKSKRASPPAQVSQKLASGATLTIDYSQPSVKGRIIGVDIAPYGKIWRTGANEATVFEFTKDVKIGGETLAAGKYSFYTIPGEENWVLIFNKNWKQWGSNDYKETEDALRLNSKSRKSAAFTEQMTFTVSEKGEVSLIWGDKQAEFHID